MHEFGMSVFGEVEDVSSGLEQQKVDVLSVRLGLVLVHDKRKRDVVRCAHDGGIRLRQGNVRGIVACKRQKVADNGLDGVGLPTDVHVHLVIQVEDGDILDLDREFRRKGEAADVDCRAVRITREASAGIRPTDVHAVPHDRIVVPQDILRGKRSIYVDEDVIVSEKGVYEFLLRCGRHTVRLEKRGFRHDERSLVLCRSEVVGAEVVTQDSLL